MRSTICSLVIFLVIFTSLSLASIDFEFSDLFNFNFPFLHNYNIKNLPTYAPRKVSCPTVSLTTTSNSTNYTNIYSQWILPASNGVPLQESAYISFRSSNRTSHALFPFAQASNLSQLDIQRILFTNDSLRPNTAIAFSGGGYRAMLNGASVFRALDNRTTYGGLAGLLQGMNYMVGLSGGNWLIGSSALNDFMTINELRDTRWNLEKGLVTGVKGNPKDDPEGVLRYLTAIKNQVSQKAKAGFVVTLTDYWSMALGRQLVNRTSGGPQVLWSDIAEKGAFRKWEMPFPISISVERRPGEKVVERNSTVFEATPYFFGSWDSAVPYFFPMKYLGTRMDSGKPTEAEDEDKDKSGEVKEASCTTGFDVGAFIMGTSSSLFSGIIPKLGRQKEKKHENDDIWALLKRQVRRLLGEVVVRAIGGNEDIAYYPNPFYGYPPLHFQFKNISTRTPSTTHLAPNLSQNQSSLDLADGGLDNQNIPFWPLLQPHRKIDFILAVDSSADTHQHWPNGSSLIYTQSRTQNLIEGAANGSVGREYVVPFPYVPPDFDTWVKQGLNNRPVFFGCNGKNYTKGVEGNATELIGPLILYLPNVPWTYYTNTSTFQLDYIPVEVNGFLDNGARQVLQSTTIPRFGNGASPANNNTLASNSTNVIQTSSETKHWTACVGCAILQRSKERAGIPIGQACEQCFKQYCWGGGYSELGGKGSFHIDDDSKIVYDPVLKDGSGKPYKSQHDYIKRQRKRLGVGEHNSGD